jgi:hypothetical protein
MRASELAFVVVGLAEWPTPPQVASWSPVRMESGKPVGVEKLHLVYNQGSGGGIDRPCYGVISGESRFEPAFSLLSLVAFARATASLALSPEERDNLQEEIVNGPVEPTGIAIDGQLVDAHVLQLRGRFGLAAVIDEGATLVTAYGNLPLAQLNLVSLPDYEMPDYVTT